MKVLIVGSGGREHALVWKIAQSPKVKKIFCAPGNAGIAGLATCVPVGAEDINGLLELALAEKIDLTIVGPEGPLTGGIVDIFEQNGLRVFGASQKAAMIESSKSFAKALMEKYGIPAARGRTFTNYKKAESYIKQQGAPIVVKADGLAAGKGVMVCQTVKEALEALKNIMLKKEFGVAGEKVIVEECLKGEEASFLAFTDGKTVLPLPSSQDHKAIFDEDKGPNTGGMGAYSPAPIVDPYMHKKIMNEIMIPTVKAMAAEGRPYKGVLYAGLMIDGDSIRVLEFNARFGDPETQPLLIRMKNDLVPVMEAVIEERLAQCSLDIDKRVSICVVMASGGYPGSYEKGLPISGLAKAGRMKDVVVFHAGTAKKDDQILASGGRVLGVTALGETIEKAISKAYQAVSGIEWKNCYFRKDIGQKAMLRIKTLPKVGIVMGSDSDLGVMEGAVAILKKFNIPFEMTVASAHRSPERAADFARNAGKRGIKVIIAGAGHAAHLAGAMAAQSSLPVIGVPIDSSCLQGLDALLSTVQMPPGIPVATVSIGKPGATNAGILAAQILALSDPVLDAKLIAYKKEMAVKIEKKAKILKITGNIQSVDSVNPDPSLMAEAADVIRNGGVVLFPTTGLYGLGGDASQPKTVERIFRLKKRSPDKPLLILVNGPEDLPRLVKEIPESAERIMKRFWPGRVSLIFNASGSLPGNLTAGTGKIGIRVPKHPVARAIVRALASPLTGTSANLSGKPGCARISDIDTGIVAHVELVLDAGLLKGGTGSTVVDVTGPIPAVIRQGEVTRRDIIDAAG